MAEFYNRIDAAKKPLLSDDLVGRLYRLLADARTKTSDPAVVRRLDELTLYVRYVELFGDYASASGPARQAAFEQVIRHGYRMRGTMLIHTKALYRDLAARDKSVTVPSEAAWNVPEAKNPWKSSAPFARDEVDAISAAGIANRKPFDFTPVAFSDRLVPAAPLKLADGKPGSFGGYFRGTNEFFGWLDRPGKFTLAGGGGMIYTTQGDAKFALYPALEPEGKAVANGKLSPTKKAEEFSLSSDYAELHRLEGSGGGGFWMTFPSEGRWTVRSSLEHPFHFHGRFSLYFYVPKGTADVAGFGSGPGTMRDGSGKLVHTFDPAPKYFRVPVPKGEDGKLWKFENSAGARHLMTVPPYLARSAAELLLPREVVEADAK